MTYNFSLRFYTLFLSFRAQRIIGKCTSRHLFSYGGFTGHFQLDLCLRKTKAEKSHECRNVIVLEKLRYQFAFRPHEIPRV